MKKSDSRQGSYQVFFEEQVSRRLKLSQDLVRFKRRVEATYGPVMICSIADQVGYDEVFTWDEADDNGSHVVVVPKIGRFGTPEAAQQLFIVLQQKQAWPDPFEVLRVESSRTHQNTGPSEQSVATTPN